jgi:hypothetical protein
VVAREEVETLVGGAGVVELATVDAWRERGG